jgi:NitT/TauT family transport system permease protein
MNRTLRWLIGFVLPPLLLLLLVLLAWDAAVVWLKIAPYVLPRPWGVWAAASDHARELRSASGLTAAGALCGFAASLVAGTAVALVFSQSRVIQRSIYPYAIFLQTVPVIAIAPLVITWFGTGFLSVAIVAFIISLFPIITNATAGLTTIDQSLLELFAMHNASRAQVLLKLRLPNAVPYLVAGAKISCGLSVIGAIVGEMFAGYGTDSFGLGYLMVLTSGKLSTDYLFAAVVCSTLLGIAIFGAVSLIGSTILSRWHTTSSDDNSFSRRG